MMLRCATINAHGGPSVRVAQAWGRWLATVATARRLDVVFLQEMTPAHRQAARYSLGAGWDVVWDDSDKPGAGETVIAIRRGTVAVEAERSVWMGPGWWGRHVKRIHSPRRMQTCRLDIGVILASLHAPPGVDVTPTRLSGPDDRVRAWRIFWRSFRRWAISRKGPWIAAGDLNEPRRSRGETSPSGIARAVDARVVTAGGIDGVIASRGIRITDVRSLEPGPGLDHKPVVFTATL